MKTLLILTTLLLLNPQKNVNPEQIIGKWMSEGKDMTVEVFKVNERFSAKLIWFDCTAPNTPKMLEHFDTENPDAKLRTRLWLGMVLVNDLKFDGQSEWNGGSIYDPNSGRTYKSTVRLQSPSVLIVRGYWGIELLGRSLKFTKI